MALLFTKVNVSDGEREVDFLSMGKPKTLKELSGYSALEHFLEVTPDEADLTFDCTPYLYGEMAAVDATIEEIAYLTMRMNDDENFLDGHCKKGEEYSFSIHMRLGNRRITPFGDEGRIVVPKEPIDCSRLGYFDSMEDECWELIKSYAERLGIDILPGEDGEEAINFDLAKRIQDTILNEFMMAGVEMKFSDEGIDNPEDVRAALRNMDKGEMFDEDIYEFETIDELFNYFYDEEVSKRALIEKLSTNEKFELISEYMGERILQMDGKYYVNNESFASLDTEYYTQNGNSGNITM